MSANCSNLSLALARECVQASARAYQEKTLESELAQVLVMPATGARPTIIAFRGSADVRAWLTDLRVGRTPTIYGRLHMGFWISANSVMGQIMRMPEIMAGLPMVVTGHSKGAAEALICARLLQAAGKPISAVITFGGPRVGDAQWKADYNRALGEVTQRWVHEEDIVPRLPPWITGYRQVGHESFISSLWGVELDPSILMLAASDLWGTFWGYRAGHIEQAADHPISRYQEHLASL